MSSGRSSTFGSWPLESHSTRTPTARIFLTLSRSRQRSEALASRQSLPNQQAPENVRHDCFQHETPAQRSSNLSGHVQAPIGLGSSFPSANQALSEPEKCYFRTSCGELRAQNGLVRCLRHPDVPGTPAEELASRSYITRAQSRLQAVSHKLGSRMFMRNTSRPPHTPCSGSAPAPHTRRLQRSATSCAHPPPSRPPCPTPGAKASCSWCCKT